MDEVVATLSLVALILVLFSSTLTYLAYVLAGIAYSLLECGALYMGLLLGRLYPGTRVRILATAWCVGTLGSLPLLASVFFGLHIASRVAMLFMALLLVVASIWFWRIEPCRCCCPQGGGAKLTSLSGRPLESFRPRVWGLSARERDVFNALYRRTKRPLHCREAS